MSVFLGTCPTTGLSSLANRITFLRELRPCHIPLKAPHDTCFTGRSYSPDNRPPCSARPAQPHPADDRPHVLLSHDSFLTHSTHPRTPPSVHKEPRHIPTPGSYHWLIPLPRDLFPRYWYSSCSHFLPLLTHLPPSQQGLSWSPDLKVQAPLTLLLPISPAVLVFL